MPTLHALPFFSFLFILLIDPLTQGYVTHSPPLSSFILIDICLPLYEKKIPSNI